MKWKMERKNNVNEARRRRLRNIVDSFVRWWHFVSFGTSLPTAIVLDLISNGTTSNSSANNELGIWMYDVAMQHNAKLFCVDKFKFSFILLPDRFGNHVFAQIEMWYSVLTIWYWRITFFRWIVLRIRLQSLIANVFGDFGAADRIVHIRWYIFQRFFAIWNQIKFHFIFFKPSHATGSKRSSYSFVCLGEKKTIQSGHLVRGGRFKNQI